MQEINDCLCVFTGALEAVLALNVLEKEFYYGSLGGNIRSFVLDTGKRSQLLKGHTSWVTCLYHQEDELFSSSKDGEIRIWDLKKGECRDVIRNHEGGVGYIDVNNALMASGGNDGLVMLWDVTKTPAKCLKVYAGHLAKVSMVQLFHPNLVVSASFDGFIKIVDITKDKVINIINTNDNVPINCFTSEKGLIYAGVNTGELYTIDYKNDEIIARQKIHTDSILSISDFGKYVLTGSEDHTMKQYLINERKVLHTYTGHKDSVKCICVTDEERVFSGSFDHSVIEWDVGSIIQRRKNSQIAKKELELRKKQEKELTKKLKGKKKKGKKKGKGKGKGKGKAAKKKGKKKN